MSTAEKKNHYEVLNVSVDAPLDAIKKAHRQLSAQHKDNDEKLKKVHEAYSVLKDPEKRKGYDQESQKGLIVQDSNDSEYELKSLPEDEAGSKPEAQAETKEAPKATPKKSKAKKEPQDLSQVNVASSLNTINQAIATRLKRPGKKSASKSLLYGGVLSGIIKKIPLLKNTASARGYIDIIKDDIATSFKAFEKDYLDANSPDPNQLKLLKDTTDILVAELGSGWAVDDRLYHLARNPKIARKRVEKILVNFDEQAVLNEGAFKKSNDRAENEGLLSSEIDTTFGQKTGQLSVKAAKASWPWVAGAGAGVAAAVATSGLSLAAGGTSAVFGTVVGGKAGLSAKKNIKKKKYVRAFVVPTLLLAASSAFGAAAGYLTAETPTPDKNGPNNTTETVEAEENDAPKAEAVAPSQSPFSGMNIGGLE